MTRTRSLSQQTRTILALMADAGSEWLHGYELCRRGNIKSGTLYPMLMRLEQQGYLVADWQAAAEPGRPPRHAYRLTAEGRALALANPPAEAAPALGAPSGTPA